MAKAKGLRAKKEEEVKEVEATEVEKSAANPEGEKVENAPKNDAKQDELHEEEEDAKVDPKEKKEDDAQVAQVLTAQPDTKKASSAKVRVKPNQDIKTYIGDTWYNLKKGKQENVPASVKAILQNAGLLDAL